MSRSIIPLGPSSGEELLLSLVFAHNRSVRAALRERLVMIPFSAYARLLCQLLDALGYQNVQMLGRTAKRQRTRSGGRDAQALLKAGVSSADLLVQVKQYEERPVSRRFVDELRGAMSRTGAGQGLIITTSSFSRAARQAAEENAALPVRLVGGEELLDMLFRFRLGVRQSSGYLWAIDERYFQMLTQVDALATVTPLRETSVGSMCGAKSVSCLS